MSTRALLCAIVCVGVASAADASRESDPAPIPSINVSLSGGLADTFQMVLGGMYGGGPALQDKLAVNFNNAFRSQDTLTAFGWSTTDLPTSIPSWQAGLLYKTRLLRRNHQALFVTGGIQRWVLPTVKTGAKDWLFTGNLTYGTQIKRIPIFFSEDSFSLLHSTLPTGSAIYSQIYTQHSLLKREHFQLLLRQGPAHSYAWGFYGAEGNRVVRYGGTVVAVWRGTTIEGGYRKQFGLQDRIHDNRYWSFQVTRQIASLKLARN